MKREKKTFFCEKKKQSSKKEKGSYGETLLNEETISFIKKNANQHTIFLWERKEKFNIVLLLAKYM